MKDILHSIKGRFELTKYHDGCNRYIPFVHVASIFKLLIY